MEALKRRKRRSRPGRRPPLEIADILAWADEFFARVGRWPQIHDGKITGQLGLTWNAVHVALAQGHRGLRPGSSLAKLLREQRGKVHRNFLPHFTVEKILSWADAFHERTGGWPMLTSGTIEEAPAESWHKVHHALCNGNRGLPGGSSLAGFLTEHRGVRNHFDPPPLTIEQILGWADAHRQRTGNWPHRDSGPLPEVPGETWMEIDGALRQGRRMLPANGGSLAQLLDQARGVRNRKALPHLQLPDILRWARAHYERTGKWPTHISGPVADAPGETWSAIHSALYAGARGFPGGSSLYQVIRPLREEARQAKNGQAAVPAEPPPEMSVS